MLVLNCSLFACLTVCCCFVSLGQLPLISLTLQSLTSIRKFSILFLLHFPYYWQGPRFPENLFHSDNFLHSHGLNVWFKDDAVRRNQLLFTLRNYNYAQEDPCITMPLEGGLYWRSEKRFVLCSFVLLSFLNIWLLPFLSLPRPFYLFDSPTSANKTLKLKFNFISWTGLLWALCKYDCAKSLQNREQRDSNGRVKIAGRLGRVASRRVEDAVNYATRTQVSLILTLLLYCGALYSRVSFNWTFGKAYSPTILMIPTSLVPKPFMAKWYIG